MTPHDISGTAAFELASNNPSFTVVNGLYCCPVEGKRTHWWCVDGSGIVQDPTKSKFPSGGSGEYLGYVWYDRY